MYLPGDTLPSDPTDRAVVPFPLYYSAARAEDEVSDSTGAGPSAPSGLPPALGSPDLTTPRT